MQKTLYAAVIFALFSYGATNFFYLATDINDMFYGNVELATCNDI